MPGRRHYGDNSRFRPFLAQFGTTFLNFTYLRPHIHLIIYLLNQDLYDFFNEKDNRNANACDGSTFGGTLHRLLRPGAEHIDAVRGSRRLDSTV